jgi:hypothetical protein
MAAIIISVILALIAIGLPALTFWPSVVSYTLLALHMLYTDTRCACSHTGARLRTHPYTNARRVQPTQKCIFTVGEW